MQFCYVNRMSTVNAYSEYVQLMSAVNLYSKCLQWICIRKQLWL